MKRNYTNIISAIAIAICSINTALAQISPVDTVMLTEESMACAMEVTDEVNRIYIPPRAEILARMADTNRMPCATINVTYNNFPPDIFGGAGPEQQAFQFAIDIWESLLDSPVPITINANWTNLGANTLGSAGAAFQSLVPGEGATTFYPAALAEQLVGAEINGANSVDINCNFNSQFANWYFGTDGNTPANEFDFVTIVLHEIGHGMGIAGFGRSTTIGGTEVGVIRRTINNQFPSSLNDPSAIYFNIWDTFMQNEDIFTNNVDMLDESNYPDPSTTMLGGMTNNLLTCNSPIAVAQNSGVFPKMFSPNPFDGGSSYSHFDEQTFNNTNTALMTPQAARGEAIHDPGDVAMGFMEDMGWTLCGRTLTTDSFALENLKVSPNPFVDAIIIDVPSNLTNQEFNLSIVDINGRVILNQTSTANSGEISISNLSSLGNAIYFLKISSRTSDLSITKKIVKK